MSQKGMVRKLKQRDWAGLREWLGDFNIDEIKLSYFMHEFTENQQESFWMVLCFIFAEYSKGLQNMLRNDDTMDNQNYQESLAKI